MRILPIAFVAGLALSTPAQADPTIGLGLSFAFGSGNVDTGIGLRVFSDNRRNRAVGSLGLDYMFTSQSLRGTVGAGYLSRNLYGGVDLGYNFGSGNFDFGASVGAVNTKRRSSSESVPPEPVEPDGPTTAGGGGGGSGLLTE